MNYLCAILVALSLLNTTSAHQCEFDAKYINENSTGWPADRYGKIIDVDHDAQRFAFLKNTVYDDRDWQTVVGRSRNCVHWSADTRFVRIESSKDFNGLKGPLVVKFQLLNGGELKKLEQGTEFYVATATVYPDLKSADGIEAHGDLELVALFTPDKPTSGIIQIDSKPIRVIMSRRKGKIIIETVEDAGALKEGSWSARITGAEANTQFVATHVELTALPDPREGDDPKLPRLLVIGDSISMNYENAAKEALQRVVNYRRCEGNSFSANYGIQYADFWLGNHPQKGLGWDVIQFNHGLHDLKQTGPDAPYATSLEMYKNNLRILIARLQASGAKLIWCSTTPVPKSSGGRYGRQKGAETAFNKAALEVLKDYPDIQINDLCKVVNDSAVFDKFRKGSDVHYYKEPEQKALGEAVAAAVRSALGDQENHE
jgi:hypothetical protein